MAQPLVSIVIPCYKGEAYLAAAIESCRSQTYPALEILVIDDASPDRCGAIADRFASQDARIKSIRCAQNGGVSRAFNRGYHAAAGKYQTRLAQDDVFVEDAIATLVAHLEAHPEIGLAYADYRRVDEAMEELSYVKVPDAPEVLRYGNRVGLCMMWRREVWKEVGEFDPAYDTVEDFEYWTRVAKKFRLGKCGDRALLCMRMHAGMGSQVYSVKQEVLAARVLAKNVPGRLEAAIVLERGYFNAAYNAMKQGARRDAMKYLWNAMICWPFDIRLFKLLAKLLLLVPASGRHKSPMPSNGH